MKLSLAISLMALVGTEAQLQGRADRELKKDKKEEAYILSDAPSMVPSSAPSGSRRRILKKDKKEQAYILSDVPSMLPSEAPSILTRRGRILKGDITSKLDPAGPDPEGYLLGSDAPSMVPSQVPSSVSDPEKYLLGSDAPSMVPSQVPSSVLAETRQLKRDKKILSDAPSIVPSEVPTAYSRRMKSEN